MSETELRVVCKSCGAEVSPYVTECPYCGTRVRKRAPKLERRDGGLEPKKSRREKRKERQAAKAARELVGDRAGSRPWASIALILVPALAILARIASGGSIEGFGALVVPFDSEWWRFLTAPFAYESVGYLFAVALAVALFGPALERRLGSVPALILLVACGSLGVLAAFGIEEQRDVIDFIGGGNGLALGAIAAWFVIERREAGDSEEDRPDLIGVLVCAAVVMLLPVVVETANVWSAIAGGAVGALAGFVATLGKR
jgi:hypothetical protein